MMTTRTWSLCSDLDGVGTAMITSRVMSVPSSAYPRRVANPSRSPRQADFADPLGVVLHPLPARFTTWPPTISHEMPTSRVPSPVDALLSSRDRCPQESVQHVDGNRNRTLMARSGRTRWADQVAPMVPE